MKSRVYRVSPLRIIFFVLAIAVMVTIFVLSSQNAEKSSNTSKGLTKVAVKIIDSEYEIRPPAVQKALWKKASFIVRKLAHFSIYMALGFCISCAVGKRRLLSAASFGVVAFGFLYALSDELHQMASEGRSCELRDMMIDTGGVLVGMLISMAVFGIIALFSKRKTRRIDSAAG